MADFGKKTIGATLSGNKNNIRGTEINPTMNGEVVSITAYIKGNWTAGEKIKCILYDISGNLIASTNELSAGSADDTWVEFTFASNPSVVAGVDYMLGIFSDEQIYIALQNVGGRKTPTAAGFTYPSLPDPVTVSTGWQSTMYATVKGSGNIKSYVGGVFADKLVKTWTGSAWVRKPVKRWNGSAWITTNY